MRKRWKRVAVSVLTAGMLFFGGIAIPPLNGGKVYAGTISPTTENKGNMTITLTIKGAASVTTAPTANTLTYTESAQALVTAGAAEGGTMQYSLDGTNYSATIPTGTVAGNYTVYYKVVGDADHNDSAGGNVTVTIGKATPTVTAPMATNPSYTGSAQNLITAGTTTGGTMQYSLDNSTYSTEIPQGTEKQAYTVYYKVVGNENYNDVAAQTLTSTISDKPSATITTAPTAKTLTYTGSAQALVTAGAANGGTMQYSLDGTNYSATIPTGTTAGNYTVYYKVVGDADHNDSESGNVAVTIGKATPTVTAPTATNPTYTGSAQNLITSGTTTGGEMQYSTDGSSYSTSIPQGTEKAVYTVYYKVVGDTNYNDVAAQTLTSTISDKPSATITTAPTAKALTYTGSAQALVTAGAANGGTIQYSTDGTNYSVTIPTGTTAGNYTVYYKVVGDADHNDSEVGSVAVSIGKATPTVTAPTATNPTYTGSAQNLITAGTTTGGTMQYSLDNSTYSTEIPQGTEKQAYTVYYKVVGNENYNDVAAQTLTSTISDKPSATITTAPTAKTLTYTGSAQALVTAGAANGGTIQYSTDGTNYSATIPTGTAAGNYTVYYKAVGDASHSDSAAASVTVTISAAAAQNTTNNTETSTDSDDDNDTSKGTEYYSEVSIYTGEVKDITGTTEATKESNPYSTSIVNSNNLESLLNVTAEEKAAGVNVWLDVKDASTTVPAADKTAIQSAARGYTVGVYLDISLFKKVGSGNPAKVTDTNGKVKVSIVIPENLRTAGRTFEVIRVHNGVSTVIQGTYDAANHTFTFETDQFSSYAIAYKDSTTSPKTGDTLHGYSFWLLIMAAGIAVSAGAFISRKKAD